MSALPISPLPAAGRVEWRNLPGAAAALAVAETAEAFDGLVAVICAGEQRAYRMEEELRFFLADRLPVVHLPDTEVLPYESFSPHQEILSARLAALSKLPGTRRGVLVATVDALVQRLPPPEWLDGRSFRLRTGDTLPPGPFRERLVAAGYQSVSEVQMQGEFAVRGSLIDLFPMGSETPYRIDLFDDRIDSVRTFDPESQRSAGTVGEIRLLPAREFSTDAEGIERFRRKYRERFAGDPARSSIYAGVSRGVLPAGIESWLPLFHDRTAGLAAYLPERTLVVELDDLADALDADWRQINERHERLGGDRERPLLPPEELFFEPAAARESLARFPAIRVHADAAPHARTFGVDALPPGATSVQGLMHDPAARILFVAESPGRREALQAWLKPQGVTPARCETWHAFREAPTRCAIVLGPVQEGLRLPGGLAIVGEAQVFGPTAPAQQRRRARVRDPESLLRDLTDLSDGSPVVHLQHGVGRYRGLTRLDAGGVTAEYLVLEYAGGDRLYVPVGSLSLIHRFLGTDAENAPLHALGSDRWDKARRRARERAHDVAAELLQVQARRAARAGRSFVVRGPEYERFCAAFPFTTTPDQQRAIDEVLQGLAADRPMDRVVCGDVGFGKTEVALRAAFAVVQNGRQVCVLVPTTLLAQQHHKNFSDRFADWPVRVGVLSRLRNSREQKQLLEDLHAGRVDVVIGTHRLLQDDVRFRDLGLVIVDEEHRFGVRHKERLKNLRAEVDVLTLTATPIPRTLNMALGGLRDLSLIATPPEGRLPIRTFVAEWNRGLVYEACLRELRRGGQVYYLHNEVVDIERIAREVQQLVPEGRVRIAHGQMRERELEQVMLDFYHRRFDILVCTTIIESGIDVPTANTLIVDRADTLGLAQLYQLRGRVGRSHHRAYAYLMVPSRRALKGDAARRLEVLEAMDELGSGFTLATHDLEIRGAGELLGEEQSGQIDEVGFTLYADLLAAAVRSIRAGEVEDRPFGTEACEVDLGVTALLPEDYIPDVHTRLVQYKRVAEAGDDAALAELRAEMVDRFGELPEPARRLFDAAGLRARAQAAGITRIRAGRDALTLEFGPRPRLDPAALIRLVQSQPRVFRLEGQQKLHQAAELPDADARVAAISRLLATLGGTDAAPGTHHA